MLLDKTSLRSNYNKFLSPIWLHSLIASSSLLLLVAAFYLEYVEGLEPCPLCMLQRIVFFFVAILCLVSVLKRSSNCSKKYAYGIIALAIIGACLSVRHLYLQSLPYEELPPCLPGLTYMIDTFPLLDIMQAMVMGTGECGDILWTFLGLSIPGWTLVAFVSIAIGNILLVINLKSLM